MAAFNKFNQFVEDRNNGVHNLGADSIKFMLTNTLPTAGQEILSEITEIATGNGYTAGGEVVAMTSSTQTAGAYSLVPTADVVITASGGSIGPFQYCVLYNDTPTSPLNPLMGWYDRGSAVTLLDTETFTFDVGATIFTGV